MDGGGKILCTEIVQSSNKTVLKSLPVSFTSMVDPFVILSINLMKLASKSESKDQIRTLSSRSGLEIA